MKKLLFLILLCFPDMVSATGQEILRDRANRTFGYVDQGNGRRAVRNKSKHIIGYVDARGTYNSNKKRIARSPQPGLLFSIPKH